MLLLSNNGFAFVDENPGRSRLKCISLDLPAESNIKHANHLASISNYHLCPLHVKNVSVLQIHSKLSGKKS